MNTGTDDRPEFRPVRENQHHGSILLWRLNFGDRQSVLVLIGPKAGYGLDGRSQDLTGKVALIDGMTYTALRVRAEVEKPHLYTYVAGEVEVLAAQLSNQLRGHRASTRADGPGNLTGHIGR